ncbi:A24 family peptidase [Sphingomonas sp. TREG-RG-20F-R18-01]|uniref:prepilin peptidase n=1 Tax=Sphingomonas sp. TREG-RG-20F-R18-01 TaxID=2914982 RepID=UPI001F55E347|nr:A24 family peptidase [Sphingomonas sp. TREG-RG-20F-R18-01]
MDDLIWPILLGGFGAIIGSFIATIVVRWPEGRSVVHGRSACDGCGVALGARDLVPLLSALVARGRCRTCGARIDPLHWQIELTALVIGVAAGLVAPGVAGAAGAVFGWLLLTLGALDVVAFWLPDGLTGTLALAGLATGALGVMPLLLNRVIGGVAGFVALWAVGAGYRLLRGRDGLGGGDPKLLGAIGLWLGWRMLPTVVLFAALAGLGIAVLGALRGRPTTLADRMPFGALLAIAAYPAWLMLVGMAS